MTNTDRKTAEDRRWNFRIESKINIHWELFGEGLLKSPITAEIEGIKSAITHLHKQK